MAEDLKRAQWWVYRGAIPPDKIKFVRRES
jgi:hypothetical protein